MKKYMDECVERRRLHNELIELRGNIRVFCKCRPLSSHEVKNGCIAIVEIDPDQKTKLQFAPASKEKKVFKFDCVLGPEDDQGISETVPIVRSVMDGFNVCIFVYGQTGAGKTFTMDGVPENRGMNYRALQELFRMLMERIESIVYTFSVTILEIYNEKIRDLLDESNDPSERLQIMRSADGTQGVPGLVDIPVCNTDEGWEKLKFAARNRSVGATNANKLSSRSHRTRPPVLKADPDATVDIGIASRSRAIRDNIENLLALSFHHFRVSKSFLSSSFSSAKIKPPVPTVPTLLSDF
ncbi:hypothetical protein U9M48_000679 [Paspalum notatum var. saurae]|uniref:Kinesin motor domain-containing protein n=1 Tax=Paspalum notatum var. saurae TaxID=547442 RepID=A0AAQ3PH57_PASNO